MKTIQFLPLLSTIPLWISCAETKNQDRPNIIFILSDDHAKTAISLYGGLYKDIAPTPNIDKIGTDGAVLNNMLCTNSISGPSRASILTGLYSHKHGLYQNEGGLVFDGSQTTFPKLLNKNGYNTALVGKWHLYSVPEGFDYFKYHDNPGQQGTYWDPIYNENGTKVKETGYCTNLTTNFALDWLSKGRDKSKPFALLLHYKAPHRPWEPDSSKFSLFEDIEMPYPPTFNDDYSGRELTAGKAMMRVADHMSRRDMKQVPPATIPKKELEKWFWYGGSGQNQVWTPNESWTTEEIKKWKFQTYIKDYLRCVSSVDDNVGRVLDYLKANGLEKNTIVVYVGDQGYFLGEHGFYDKRFMYEESLQMPTLIRYPAKIKAGTQLNGMYANIDYAPTLLDYAGIPIPENMQGKSFRNNLDKSGTSSDGRKAFYYSYYEYPKWHNVQPHYGVRTNRFKLIHFFYDVDLWEFYDLEKDPDELTNQINNPSYLSEIERLKTEIVKLQVEFNDEISLDARREMVKKVMRTYKDGV